MQTEGDQSKVVLREELSYFRRVGLKLLDLAEEALAKENEEIEQKLKAEAALEEKKPIRGSKVKVETIVQPVRQKKQKSEP